MATSLLRSQVNALIKLLPEAGVGPNVLDFKEETIRGKFAVALPLKISTIDGAFFFEIRHYEEYWAQCFPGPSHIQQAKYHSSWDLVLAAFKEWLQRIKHELDEPDPWLLVRNGRLLSGDIPRGREGESTLGESELKVVHHSIEDIRAFLVAEAQPNPVQLVMIDERLKYLEDCAKTQDKKGWSYTAVGVIFTIGAALSLSPEQGHKLLMLTSEMIRSILQKLLP